MSRRRGIGFAVVVRLAELGANVFIHHYSPNDAEQPWGTDDLDELPAGLSSALAVGVPFGDLGADMADPLVPARVVDAAVAAIGPVRILVSGSTLLLTRHFTEQLSGAAAGE